MLSGLRVLSTCSYLAGPLATRLLSDLGAEVVKVEHVAGGDSYRNVEYFYGAEKPAGDLTHRFAQYNRGKKSVPVNLKDEEGAEVFRRLARESDVLIDNMPQGALERFGLGYEEIHRENEALVYCSITGYGETGPNRAERALDLTIQAEGGLIHRNSQYTGTLAPTGIYVADIATGTHAAMSVLAALASPDGEGTHIDVSMLDSLVSLMNHEAGEFSASGTVGPDIGFSSIPAGIYETGKGALTLIVRGTQWERFCSVTGIDEEIDPSEYDELSIREDHEEEIEALVREALSEAPAGEWVKRLREAGILAAPVNTVEEALTDEQIRERGLATEVTDEAMGTYTALRYPALFSGEPMRSGAHVPRFGEHTREVLAGLGYDPEEVAGLEERGVVVSRD